MFPCFFPWCFSQGDEERNEGAEIRPERRARLQSALPFLFLTRPAALTARRHQAAANKPAARRRKAGGPATGPRAPRFPVFSFVLGGFGALHVGDIVWDTECPSEVLRRPLVAEEDDGV